MIKLKISPEDAQRLLKTVKHETFQEALNEHWIVDSAGNVKAQSALWLYCWGVTGMNSVDVAKHTTRLFDGLLNISFEEFKSKVPHEWAQEIRYVDGDIEEELKGYLAQ